MNRTRLNFVDVTLWGLALYLLLHVPAMEMRVDETELKYREQPPASTPAPEPPASEPPSARCFHMSREDCPPPTEPLRCKRVGTVSVFCCDVDEFRLKEGLAATVLQNTKNLHVLNADIEELNISQPTYRRLTSMSLTDGNIGKIIVEDTVDLSEPSQFPKHSSLSCLNISNNNLTNDNLTNNKSIERPFAYLYNLTMLDASSNNFTNFPLSLVQSNRQITVDFSGNNFLRCKDFQKAMESNNSSKVMFHNYDKTFCALDLRYSWFNDVQTVPIDHVRVMKELNASCRSIKPPDINCTCTPERLELIDTQATGLVAVECAGRELTVLPTNLPPNTVKLNVSHNKISSLATVGDDPSYQHVNKLIVDHNEIPNIVELEGTKFIDNFYHFSITHNKLKTIHTYVLSNKFEQESGLFSSVQFSIAGNYIHCDCNTEKVLKPWLVENSHSIPDYRELGCEDGMGPVADLVETKVCHTPRDWTDYIYYIIGLEVLTFVLLISKVSYDYWVFKTAGYLPWPANKMPRLPCDWLCES